jgi:hypothetical protein
MYLVSPHHPNASVLVRWNIAGGVEWSMELQNISNPLDIAVIHMNSPTERWTKSAAANLLAALSHLDVAYPSKIAVVQI